MGAPHGGSGLQRLEAFSDGVFAIAITLLILEVRIPHAAQVNPGMLAGSLRELLPSYLAYILSFAMIGIYWANHSCIFKLFVKSDHIFNLLNVFFLMCISFVPFPTAILGQYWHYPDARQAAVMFYVLGMLLAAFGWMAVWLYASRNFRLLDPDLDPGYVKLLTVQFIISNLLYLGALLIALWSATISLGICVALALLYLMPPKPAVYRATRAV